MKRTIWLIAALSITQPALAWEMNSSDTKKAWSYAAFQADKSGGVELQFYCDETYPKDIQMLVFTDLDARDGDSDFPSVTVQAVVDGETFADLSGYYDAVDGERTVVVDTLEEERVRDILTAARAAKQPLMVEYDGRSHRFAVDGIEAVLGDFVDGCER